MSILAIIYIALSVSSLIMSIPQLRTLLTTKRSDELHLGTWSMWFFNQVAMMVFMFTLNDTAVKTMSILWTSFYVLMLVLILHYRHHPGAALSTEAVAEPQSYEQA